MELTEAEVRRSSIKARKDRYDYRVKTEAVQEVVPEVTSAPEAPTSIEVITAAEVAVAESSDPQTVALHEASSTEETGLSSTLANHTAVRSAALESIPAQDAYAEEVKEEVNTCNVDQRYFGWVFVCTYSFFFFFFFFFF
ncbi:hypothetical protein QBC32DRAFT_232066, partial [Pseudoneurospora amorphoporcata]